MRLRRSAVLVLVCLAAFATAPSCWRRNTDVYGGWAGMQLEATGRFRLEAVDGVWWLVTPNGRPFFSSAITSVRDFGDYAPDLDSYPYLDNILARWGSSEAWAENALAQIRGAGFNTIGAFSDVSWFRGRFPYTEILTFSASAPSVPGTVNAFGALRDFFDPAFLAGAVATAELARPCAADSGLPNSTPPQYPVLYDQAERGEAYAAYLDRVLERPYIVGTQWFKHADQPYTGRNDGEDNNWGFVDIEDDVYPELYVRMWGVHQSVVQRRLALAVP